MRNWFVILIGLFTATCQGNVSGVTDQEDAAVVDDGDGAGPDDSGDPGSGDDQEPFDAEDAYDAGVDAGDVMGDETGDQDAGGDPGCQPGDDAWDPDADPGENVALGKTCAFAPVPGYALTSTGGTDPQDLTDGRLTERPDQHMWFEAHAVGWSYQPLDAIRVDLEQVEPISEISIRFLGGSPQVGITFPTFVEVLVSDDDQTYHRVGYFLRWSECDQLAFGVPEPEGTAFVHNLRFGGLRTRGRYVGLVFGGTGLTCSDELYVYRGDHDPQDVEFDPAGQREFAVDRPWVRFLKPELIITNQIAAPVPVALLDESGVARQVQLRIDVPPGVEIPHVGIGSGVVSEPLPQGMRYTITADIDGTSHLYWGRLYFRASLPDDQTAELSYSLDWGEGYNFATRLPLRAVNMIPAPRLTRFMLALGWSSLASTQSWPEGLDAAEAIGLNTISTFAHWMSQSDTELWEFRDQVQQRGFRMLNVDSTFHRIDLGANPEATCQFQDGTHGTHLCPSYRGPAYQNEVQRVADQCARLLPDYLSTDIEIWGWRGPVDAEDCTRCQADKLASGIASWDEWKLQKGFEMWTEVHQAVQAAVSAAGGGPVEMGSYDWRPGMNYQFTWPFDLLYPQYLQNSQVSTYTPLRPYHIEFIGDEVRQDRERLPRSDVLPWLTPGDAGIFTGEALRCAMLECFLNGARGIHFWSSRYWDAEYLLAYNQAVREIAPIEDLLYDGELYQDVQTAAPARVSAIRCGDDLVILAGEYHGHAPTTVDVILTVPADSQVVDALTGDILGQLSAGQHQTLEVELSEHRSRVLWIRANK